MGTASGAETVGEAQEIDLVDLVEDRHHGLLDDLVLQGRDAQRTLPAVGLRDVSPFRRLRPIGARVDPPMQVRQAIVEAVLVLLPGHAVHPRGCVPLEGKEAVPEQIDRDMVEQGGEPRTLIPACRFAHTLHSGQPVSPALRPARGLRQRVPLSRSPSLHSLRRRWWSVLVRGLLWYYATVRLPSAGHAGRAACGLLRPTRRTICGGQRWDLSVPV